MIMFKIPIAQIHHFKIPTALSKYQQTIWLVQNTNRHYDHVHNTNQNPGTPKEQSLPWHVPSWVRPHLDWPHLDYPGLPLLLDYPQLDRGVNWTTPILFINALARAVSVWPNKHDMEYCRFDWWCAMLFGNCARARSWEGLKSYFTHWNFTDWNPYFQKRILGMSACTRFDEF